MDYTLEDAMREYAEAQQLESMAKEKKDRAKEVILKFMLDNDLDKQPTSMGTFSIGIRRSYQYTPELEIRAEELKKAQKEEEAKGIAACTENPYVLFKANKDGE